MAPPRTSYYGYNKDIAVLPDVEFRWQAIHDTDDVTYDIAVWSVEAYMRKLIGPDGKVVAQPEATVYMPGVLMDPDQCHGAPWWGKLVCGAERLNTTSWRAPTPLRRGRYGWSVRLRKGDKVSGWCYAEEKGISSEGTRETTLTPFLFTVVDPNDPPPPVDAIDQIRRGFMWP